MPRSGRAGFSVIEALVVLAITGTALLLVFQMGVSGSRTGFRLGNRALTAADAEPGGGGLRTIIRGARFDSRRDGAGLGPPAGPAGDSRTFTTPGSLDRETVCAAAGPVARLQLVLVETDRGDLLTCASGPDAASATLLDLRPARAAFSYSEDGVVWRDRWRRPTPPAEGRLYVRLTSTDGAVDIVESVDLEPLAAGGIADSRP